MIAKNKHSPSTLYLLNPKIRIQQQNRSARLTFDKKKSSRSISNYQKATGKQMPLSQPFQNHSRTNSQIKKLILHKNKFSLQPLQQTKRLSIMLNIFKGNRKSIQDSFRKSQSKDRNQISLISVRDNQSKIKQFQINHKPNQTKHKPNQANNKSNQINNKSNQTKSKLNQTKNKLTQTKNQANQTKNKLTQSKNKQTPSNIKLKKDSLLRISQHAHKNMDVTKLLQQNELKWKDYQRTVQQLKQKYFVNQEDILLDQLIKHFKFMLNELTTHYSHQIISNLQYFQINLSNVAKQYQIQINCLKDQISKFSNITNKLNTLHSIVQEKHVKGLISSLIMQQIQKSGINLQQLIKQSKLHQKVTQIQDKYRQQSIKNQSQLKIQKDSLSSDEKKDFFQQDIDWNSNFKNQQGIKQVLNYIHNHNGTKHIKDNTNSTANNNYNAIPNNNYNLIANNNYNVTSNNIYNGIIKNNYVDPYKAMDKTKVDLKIDNWKSFNHHHNGDIHKIMSQR